jgi:hypothetical protein
MNQEDYQKFLSSKEIIYKDHGFKAKDINPLLYDWQQDIVNWSCRKGRSALFEGCGLGKTIQQLEFAKQVHIFTGGNVLIFAPLAVSKQTRQEGSKFGYAVNIASSMDDIKPGINITNYEKVHKFDPSAFSGIVVDESGIMKSFTGKFKTDMCESWAIVPYKLSCSATPAPNDYEEIGNQAEFLGICTRLEMLSTFFINDTANTGTWRLKKHAENEFWQWICSWAVMIQFPSDIGYEDKGFVLPGINYISHVIPASDVLAGTLFPVAANTLEERRDIRKTSLSDKIKIAKELVENSDEQWLIWCEMNEESQRISKEIKEVQEVTGSDSDEDKINRMLGFTLGKHKALCSKPKIAGWGMNWQNCHNIIFIGLSDSFEALYQAVRRCYRFGQTEIVNVHIITHELEGNVVKNIKRKEKQFTEMVTNMTKNVSEISKVEIKQATRERNDYIPKKEVSKSDDSWVLYNEDCIETVKRFEENSIHYMLFSPPFSSLFTYSNSTRDMGNCKNEDEFFKHFDFLVSGLYRSLMPGRLLSFHVMNLPAVIYKDGYIGIKDLRGDLIRIFQKAGFIFHSEVCIWKDPLIQAVRTKALNLQHKQISKDSSRCGQGLPDYVITMRKPGINSEPVAKGRGFEEYIGEMDEPAFDKNDNHSVNKYSHHVWQRYASPVWFDIRQTRTLNYKIAREGKDEKHICPLQLDVIERCLDLWTNPGDLVYSPFAGIGSEGWCSLRMKRRFVGSELKESYFNVAVKNLSELSEPSLLETFIED